MKLIEELQKQKNANATNDGFRMMDSIKAGKYTLSIQGSTGHYCMPRKTLRPEQYERMELALFGKKGWLHINRSKVLKAFPRYSELIDRADSLNSSAPVFGYVPVDLLNDLYLYLCKA